MEGTDKATAKEASIKAFDQKAKEFDANPMLLDINSAASKVCAGVAEAGAVTWCTGPTVSWDHARN